MGIYRLPNRIVTGIWNDEAPAFAGLRRGRRMTCLRSATPKVFASRSTWQANDERSSNGQTRKAPRIALTCRDPGVRVLMLVLITIAPISIFGAAKSRPPPQLNGYKAVRVRYGPLNKMIMSVNIDRKSAVEGKDVKLGVYRSTKEKNS